MNQFEALFHQTILLCRYLTSPSGDGLFDACGYLKKWQESDRDIFVLVSQQEENWSRNVIPRLLHAINCDQGLSLIIAYKIITLLAQTKQIPWDYKLKQNWRKTRDLTRALGWLTKDHVDWLYNWIKQNVPEEQLQACLNDSDTVERCADIYEPPAPTPPPSSRKAEIIAAQNQANSAPAKSGSVVRFNHSVGHRVYTGQEKLVSIIPDRRVRGMAELRDILPK